MTLRLILMRHAKSSWGDPGLEDHARPLNGRGRRSARAIGEWLAAQDLAPTTVISSDSQRTRETWSEMAPSLGRPDVQFTPALYHANPADMLGALQAAHGQTVLLLGHNPGCAWFAHQIVSAPPDHPRFDDYPTAATLAVALPIDTWSQLTWHIGDPISFIVPRDLGIT
ncbi:MAG: histidine phosphatase family protein [Pseudomonadota bacterium]